MIFPLVSVILSLVLSFVVSLAVTSWIIRQAHRRGFIGVDVNKKDKPKVANLGGVGPIAGFIAGTFALLVYYGVYGDNLYEEITIAVLLTSLIIAFLGLLDDMLDIKQSIRAFTPVFAAVPLSVFSLGHSVINIPFIGKVDFGIWYYVVVIPVALTITANAFNMLEGLNGLGAGMGTIMAVTLSIIGLKSGGASEVAGTIALVLASSLLAFLAFNKYPAKVFPGNVGTYFIGATIGALGISGYMLTALFFLYIPYAVEFFLKARTKFRGISFGKVRDDGTLYWDETPHSLTHIVMKLGRFKEYQVVAILWAMESVFALTAYYFQVTVIKL